MCKISPSLKALISCLSVANNVLISFTEAGEVILIVALMRGVVSAQSRRVFPTRKMAKVLAITDTGA